MPTYEYRCPQDHQFEVFQRISDESEATCPECGQPAERRISGGAGFLLKGEGFYKTDYRSDDYKKKASSEQGSAEPKEASNPKESTAAKDPGSGSSSKPSTSKPSPSD